MASSSQNEELIEKIVEAKALVSEAKRKYYLSDLYAFNRDVLKWPDIYEPLHKRVCDFVQDNVKKKKLLILLPRGSFKSSIITIGYSLWRIAQDPSDRILLANATYPMACQFLSQIKDHVSKNEAFTEMFGDFALDADSWREDRITLSREKSYEHKEPTVWALGSGSGRVGSHFNIAILDDMVNRDNITTRDQIDKVIDFYKDSLDLVDSDVTGHKQVIIIGTCWHMSDLYSWIQDRETGIFQDFAMLKLPAYEGEWGKGKLLFPGRLSWDVLDHLKRQQGQSHFSSQYLLDPVPLEEAVFKQNFRYYDKTDIRGLVLNKFVTVDPAISENKEADYSSMVCVGVDHNNDWYVLDVWRDRVQPKRLIDQIFYWDEKWKPVSIGVETTAFQKSLQFYIFDEMKKRNRFIPIKELKHGSDSSKDERIRGLEPRYETGSVFHPNRTDKPEIVFLEDELRRFPRGKNDDCVDALASQLELAFPSKVRQERKYGPVGYRPYPA